MLMIIASGVPSKKWPAIVAKNTDPNVAKALITLAAVPAICPNGSIARAVRFPKVSPAWKNKLKTQNTKNPKPKFPEIAPVQNISSMKALNAICTRKAALIKRRIPNFITSIEFRKDAEAENAAMTANHSGKLFARPKNWSKTC